MTLSAKTGTSLRSELKAQGKDSYREYVTAVFKKVGDNMQKGNNMHEKAERGTELIVEIPQETKEISLHININVYNKICGMVEHSGFANESMAVEHAVNRLFQ